MNIKIGDIVWEDDVLAADWTVDSYSNVTKCCTYVSPDNTMCVEIDKNTQMGTVCANK